MITSPLSARKQSGHGKTKQHFMICSESWSNLLSICVATGEQLASAGDGGEVFLWKPGSAPAAAFGSDEEVPDPGWRLDHSLR